MKRIKKLLTEEENEVIEQMRYEKRIKQQKQRFPRCLHIMGYSGPRIGTWSGQCYAVSKDGSGYCGNHKRHHVEAA